MRWKKSRSLLLRPTVNVKPPSDLTPRHRTALYLPEPRPAPPQNPLITLVGLWRGDKNASVESSSGLDIALPLCLKTEGVVSIAGCNLAVIIARRRHWLKNTKSSDCTKNISPWQRHAPNHWLPVTLSVCLPAASCLQRSRDEAEHDCESACGEAAEVNASRLLL